MFSIEKIIENCKYSHISYRKTLTFPGVNLGDDHGLNYARSYDVFYPTMGDPTG